MFIKPVMRFVRGVSAKQTVAGLAASIACLGLVARAEPESKIQTIQREIRQFHISVDGERCGTFRMTIAKLADGRDVIEGDASLELKYFLYTFRYVSKGVETWYQGRLLQLDNLSALRRQQV